VKNTRFDKIRQNKDLKISELSSSFVAFTWAEGILHLSWYISNVKIGILFQSGRFCVYFPGIVVVNP
jgi:hypothetical protein